MRRRPSSASTRLATSTVSAGSSTGPPTENATAARARRPASVASSAQTRLAPADCPTSVSRSGSPPKRADLPLHPVQRRQQVGHRGARLGLLGRAELEEAERAEPIGDGDDDGGAAGGQHRAVVVGRGTGLEGPAVHPEQHRQRSVGAVRGVDVERQAVLDTDQATGRGGLHTDRPGRGRVAGVGPGGSRPRGTEALGGRVRDAPPAADAVDEAADDRAGGGDDEGHGLPLRSADMLRAPAVRPGPAACSGVRELAGELLARLEAELRGRDVRGLPGGEGAEAGHGGGAGGQQRDRHPAAAALADDRRGDRG